MKIKHQSEGFKNQSQIQLLEGQINIAQEKSLKYDQKHSKIEKELFKVTSENKSVIKMKEEISSKLQAK